MHAQEQRDTEQTQVIFRKWPNGDVIALFPAIVGNSWDTCLSYEHIGQHGSASVCIPNLRPAIEQEYRELKQELESIGYRLQVVRRFTSKHEQARRKQSL